MPVITDKPALGDLLKREYDKDYCREIVSLAAGDALPAGTVLGRIAASGQYVAAPAAATSGQEGAEIACAVLLEDAPASASARRALALVRGPAIVSAAALLHHASVDTDAERAAKRAQLAAFGIVVRDTV